LDQKNGRANIGLFLEALAKVLLHRTIFAHGNTRETVKVPKSGVVRFKLGRLGKVFFRGRPVAVRGCVVTERINGVGVRWICSEASLKLRHTLIFRFQETGAKVDQSRIARIPGEKILVGGEEVRLGMKILDDTLIRPMPLNHNGTVGQAGFQDRQCSL
jgi:hypothetical protein